jgi:pyruvate ferredoxin oxidoreductase alpha subunit
MGSFSEIAMEAVDRMRGKGVPVGLLKLRLWRPFPFDEIRKAMKGLEMLVVMDRAISTGGIGGPVASEIKSADPRATSTGYSIGIQQFSD